MKDTVAYKYFAGLPPWARALVLIVILGITVMIILWIKKMIKDQKDKGERKSQFINDFKDYCTGGGAPSYPATSYLTMADAIYQAGCYSVGCIGTDEDAIVSEFDKVKSTCDAIMLVQAFGKRFERGTVCYWGSCEEDKKELGGWLRTELSDFWVNKINEGLKGKGVNFAI